MLPKGRRRLSGLLLARFFLSFLFYSTASAVSSAVIGIDLGTGYIKAALVKPGVPLDIVLTKDSKRKETAAVAFKSSARTKSRSSDDAEGFPERIYGSDALALSARFPQDVYSNLKTLLGVRKDSAAAKEYGAAHPELQMVDSPETGALGFKSNSFLESELFTVEELLAMVLQNIKANAETMAGKGHSIEDAVITIPAFFTAEERLSVTRAVELAGLRPLSFLSDGLAVGLNYATSRTFPVVSEGGKPEIHMVYDIGAGSTTATILKFQGRVVKDVGKFNKTIQQVETVSASWDTSLGGDALNRLILDDMIREFTEQFTTKKHEVSAEQLKQHGRSMAKLLKEAERLRLVLSANTEASANFEGLYSEELNFKYKITRNEFETLASEYQARVQTPVKGALEMAKLTIREIDSIILHGGVGRTPFVQKQLEGLVKSDIIRSNVNSDEAAVLGAGFRAATISPSFRVKEIRTSDIAVYPVVASWAIDGKEKTQKLFVPMSIIGTEKQVAFKAPVDFEFSLSQQVSPEQSIEVSNIRTLNLTESVKSLTLQGCLPSDLSPKFAIRLSPINGLPEVARGSISCEAHEAEKKGVVDGVKDFLFGSKKDDQQPLNIESESESEGVRENEGSSTTASSATTSSILETPPGSKASEKPKEAKKKLLKTSIGLSTKSLGTSSSTVDSLQRIKDRLTAFDASDRARDLRAETLNLLEATTYRNRDLVNEEAFISASTDAERDQIAQKSNEAAAWLYEDGADAPSNKLKEKLDQLRELVKPVQLRIMEEKKRPESVKKVKDALSQAETVVKIIKQHLESQSSSTSPTSSETTTTSSTRTRDEFDDLDEETTSSITTTTSATPDVPKPVFTADDLTSVEEKRSSTQKWLDDQLAEQAKLGPTDDPVVMSSELDTRADELSDHATQLLMKQVRNVPKASKKRPKTSIKKTSSTTDTGKSSAAESSPTSSASDPPEDSPTSATEPGPSPAQPVEADPSSSSASNRRTDAGGWLEQPSYPEGEDMPSAEEEMRIRQEQQRIDEELAAYQRSIVENAVKKTKKAKTETKAKKAIKSKSKTKPKTKANRKPNTKTEGHSEL